MGGLSRKSSKISDISKNNGTQPVLIDSGNLLFKKNGNFSAISAERITAEAIASSYLEMKYHAVGIGPMDLAGGVELIKRTAGQGVPWISVNLYDNADNRIFDSHRMIQYDNLNIAIVGVTGDDLKSNEFVVKNADDELIKLLPELESSADIIILLSSLPFQQTVNITKRFTQIDLAFTADRTKGNVQPLHSGNAIICQTSSRGQYLGMLDITWHDSAWLKKSSTEINKLKRQLKSIAVQMSQLQSLPPEPRAEKTAKLEKHRQLLKDRITELENNQPSVSDLQNLSTYKATFLPLSSSVQKDPGVERIINTAKKEIKEARRS